MRGSEEPHSHTRARAHAPRLLRLRLLHLTATPLYSYSTSRLHLFGSEGVVTCTMHRRRCMYPASSGAPQCLILAQGCTTRAPVLAGCTPIGRVRRDYCKTAHQIVFYNYLNETCQLGFSCQYRCTSGTGKPDTTTCEGPNASVGALGQVCDAFGPILSMCCSVEYANKWCPPGIS